MKLKFLFIAALAILFASSCRKEGNNPIFDDNKLGVGTYLTLDSTENLNFNAADLSASVGIRVSEYGGSPVTKVNLFVVDNGSADQTWKLVKTIDFTGPGTEISATGTEVAAALGYTAADFQPGSTLTFFNQVVTAEGKKFDINNAGASVNSDDYNSSFSWTAAIVCPFTGGVAGDYKVITDDWQDYSAGDIITGAVEDGPGPNQITLHVYPAPGVGDVINPIIVDIDPETGTATVPEVQYGDYGGTLISAQGSGFVFGCTGFITLSLEHIGYGTYKLELQKQ